VRLAHDRPPVVEVKGVEVDLGGVRVLRDVNLSVGMGETIAVIGPSGSGKTTLLRCINFLVPYSAGTIYVKGELIGYRSLAGKLERRKEREVSKQRARVGFVFQRFNLFPHRTVLGNLLEGPIHVLKVAPEIARTRARAALERVGLAEKSDNYPRELSGGQQQRVAIARALCMEPDVLLLDEVTSALDPELVAEVLSVLRQLAEDGMTMIVVTHELRFAQRCATRVVFMEAGRIIADMEAKEFFAKPPSERIAAYIADTSERAALTN
jgi:polar amino acid transport system ATP-binding protein